MNMVGDGIKRHQDNLDLWATVSGLTFPLRNIESHLSQMV